MVGRKVGGPTSSVVLQMKSNFHLWRVINLQPSTISLHMDGESSFKNCLEKWNESSPEHCQNAARKKTRQGPEFTQPATLYKRDLQENWARLLLINTLNWISKQVGEEKMLPDVHVSKWINIVGEISEAVVFSRKQSLFLDKWMLWYFVREICLFYNN